uniref:Uncharacterized protein n=1 Tax=Panagrolaimus davidi TaxID=227884 RepID=A0A914PWX1_9BILA
MVISKRERFYAKYYQQNFSMPNSIIFYVAKNPKTAKFYLKMRIGEWRIGRLPLNLTKYNCKYWITDKICASASEFVDKNIFSQIIPKLYLCDVKSLNLYSQVVSFNDLSLLISSAKEICLHNVIVKHADSSDVLFEDLIKISVNAKSVEVNQSKITPKTMKELTKLSHFTKIDNLTLFNLSEVFDIDEFYDYTKRNQHTKLNIVFDPQISEGYMNRLETIVDEILETKQFDYKPPFICFIGIDIQKFLKHRQIYDSH